MTQLTVHRSTSGEKTACGYFAAGVKCSNRQEEVTCKSCQRRQPAPAGPQVIGRSWFTLRAADFDAAAPLTLFDMAPAPRATVPAKPDRCGTPDMFGDLS